MQQSCQRCGSRFTQTGTDMYCPSCKEAIEAKVLSKKKVNTTITLTCEGCGKEFTHDASAKGRRPKCCETCRTKHSDGKKKGGNTGGR